MTFTRIVAKIVAKPPVHVQKENVLQDDIVRDPIYCQVNDRLRALIRDGAFQTGDRFLTERQISERFGISRATANKALSNLVAEGVLEFRKGVGTFLAGGRLDYDLRSLVSFTEKARLAGKIPTTRVLRFEALPAADVEPEIALLLQFQPDETAYIMERLRLADAVPVILEQRHLRARFCPGLHPRLLQGSLYELLSVQYKLDVSGADETIRALSLRGEEARLLEVAEGNAGLLVTAVGFLSGGVPLWHERTLYRGDAYEFRNRLGPVTGARPATGVLL